MGDKSINDKQRMINACHTFYLACLREDYASIDISLQQIKELQAKQTVKQRQ